MSTTVDKRDVGLEVGQRRRWNADVRGAGNCFTVLKLHDGTERIEATVEYRYDDGNGPFGYSQRGVLRESTPVGSSPSTEGRPRPQAGQRWRLRRDQAVLTLTELTDGGRYWRTVRDDGSPGGGWYPARFEDGTFEFVDHGSPTPTPVALEETQPAKVSCVDCAADITERVKAAVKGGGWRCVPCNGEFQARVILAKPKEAQPAPVVAAKPIRRVPESCLLERWNETGPLSALEAIQAKKPPEPWRPSVDEYDLLPDAGTSWSDTRGSGRP